MFLKNRITGLPLSDLLWLVNYLPDKVDQVMGAGDSPGARIFALMIASRTNGFSLLEGTRSEQHRRLAEMT